MQNNTGSSLAYSRNANPASAATASPRGGRRGTNMRFADDQPAREENADSSPRKRPK